MSDNISKNTPSKLAKLTPAQQSIHNNFITSLKSLRRDLVRTAYYLLQIRDRHIYRYLGYNKISDYAATAGLNPRQCRDFLAVAKNLPQYPEIESAVKNGHLNWSHAKIICAKTDPAEQERWLDASRSMSVSQLNVAIESQDKSQKSGAIATSRQVAAPVMRPKLYSAEPEKTIAPQQTHIVSLKFSGEQYARWQCLSAHAQRHHEWPEAILKGLAGESLPSTNQNLMVILNCPICDRAVYPTNRGEIEVPHALLKAAQCDAIFEEPDGRRRQVIAPRIRRQALQKARYRCQGEKCGNATFLSLHHIQPIALGGKNDLENLIVLCSRCHRKLHENDELDRLALRQSPE